MTQETMRQEAPYPAILEQLVNHLLYKRGWWFELRDLDRGQGSKGLTLAIHVATEDTYQPGVQIRVVHYMPVPPAAYDMRSWRRWLFDQIGLVEDHEAMEWFRFPTPPKYDPDSGSHFVQPDDRPFAPSHGPGNDPYLVREPDGTDLDRRTSYLGELA